MKAHFSGAVSFLPERILALCVLGGLAAPAQAVEGCKLLLCLAGNWQRIGQCAPTVREALRDLARGRVWPSCEMSGSSGSTNEYVRPVQCPEQYRTVWTDDYRERTVVSCPFAGVVQVAVAGQPWSRTWWSTSGDSVIEWLPAAKAAFANSPGSMDDRFDRDHAAWLASGGGGE